MSDANLGVVDRFVYPTDQDSQTVKVYSQAGKACLWMPEASSNVLECDCHTITRVCRFEHGRRNSRFGLASGFNAFLCGLAFETKCDRMAQDDRDGSPGRLGSSLDREGGLPQQKALTLEITTIREWLVTSGAHNALDRRRKHDYEWV